MTPFCLVEHSVAFDVYCQSEKQLAIDVADDHVAATACDACLVFAVEHALAFLLKIPRRQSRTLKRETNV